MANPLPISFADMQACEAYLLERLGIFVNTLTGLPVFVTDKPWPASTDPAIGIRVMTYTDTGWGDWSEDETEYGSATYNLIPIVEFFAIRGSPMAALTTVRMALRGLRNFKEQMLWDYGIGCLDFTEVSTHDSVLDGVETEYRAKMLVTFSLRVSSTDIQSAPLVKSVNIQQNSYDPVTGNNLLTQEYLGMDPTEETTELNDFISTNLTNSGASTWINNWSVTS